MAVSPPKSSTSSANCLNASGPRALLFFFAPQNNYRYPLFSPQEVFCGPDAVARKEDNHVFAIKTGVGTYDVADVLRQLSDAQRPDIVVVKADATGRNFPRNLGALRCPKVLLVGDTHHMARPLSKLIDYARSEPFDFIIFDHTRNHAHFFSEAGLHALHWLPALDFGYVERDILAKPSRQLTFVGQADKHYSWTRAVLAHVEAAGLPVQVFSPSLFDTAKIYADSQITLNVSLNGDLNLHVFEALAAGGFLLTDELAEPSGLRLLFDAGRHLETWRTPGELVDKIRYYLAHPEDALRIRRQGMEEIRRAHHPEVKLREFHDLIFSGRENPRYDLSLDARFSTAKTRLRSITIQRIASYELVQGLHQQAREVVVFCIDPALLTDFADLPRLRLAALADLKTETTMGDCGAPVVHVLWWEGPEFGLASALGDFWGEHVVAPMAERAVADELERWGFAAADPVGSAYKIVQPLAFARRAMQLGFIGGACARISALLPAVRTSADAMEIASLAEALGQTEFHRSALGAAITLDRSNFPALLAYAVWTLDRGDMASTLLILEEAARVQLLPSRVEDLRASLALECGNKPAVCSYYRSIGRIHSQVTVPARRIVLVTNLFPPQELGGYGRMMWEFADGLIKRGHAVKIVTSNAGYLAKIPTPDEVQMEDHVERSLELMGQWRGGESKLVGSAAQRVVIERENSQRVLSIVHSFSADLVFAGNMDFVGPSVLKDLLTSGVAVLHALANAFPGYSPTRQPDSPRYWVAPCSDWNGRVFRDAGYRPARMETLYPGARIDRFFRLFMPDTRRLRIAYASLVMPYKGAHLLVEALGRLFVAGVDFTAEIAGDSTDTQYLSALQQFAAKIGMSDRVAFTGFLDREVLGRLFSRSNVLVFPSQFPEPFGISQVEAMAAGLVVVSSGTGGAGEIVRHDQDGLIFQANSADALAEQLIRLVAEPELFDRLQKSGQLRAQEFSVEAAIDKIESLTSDLLGESTLPAAH